MCMKLRVLYSIIVLVLLLSACSGTRFVPEGEFLLDKVQIKTDTRDIQNALLKEYLRQTPNSAVFGLLRLQLGVYNLAGRDTTKWLNRLLMRIGDKPVIYNTSLTSISVQQIQRLLENKGYINAKVQSNVIKKGKKAKIVYDIKFNKPYRLRKYNINLDNNALSEIASDTSRSMIKPNMLFDLDVFNAERERISTRFRQLGYYNFNKDFLNYTGDSTFNSNNVDMTIELRDYIKRANDSVENLVFKKYTIRKVIFYTNSEVNLTSDLSTNMALDTVKFRDFILITPKRHIIKLDALVQNTFINPKSLYSDRSVEQTYQALNSLGPIKYVNISFKENADNLLDCYIVIVPGKAISLSTELEGTYTASYWGGAGNVNYMHRNAFKGAEIFSMQVRAAYEWQKEVWAEELGVQVGLKFPKFMLPIGSYEFKRNFHANTEFTSSFSYQFRPGEFKTTSVGAGVNYSWNRPKYRHTLQLFDLNYVYFPEISQAFKDSFLNVIPPKFNPYNFQDHFIMRIGYSGSTTNSNTSRPLESYTSSRYSIETAGNLLYGISSLLGNATDSTGAYRISNIRFSQYIKAEYNITHNQILDRKSRFVYHLGFGLGVPYGNSDVIPYEKRFYSGGANSVRGWSESTLGPGIYERIDDKRRDYNQVGDVKLDMNMEYRTKLFWKLEGALFMDAGNIWTIQSYETQGKDLGMFKLDSFIKQIAIAYGLGFRFDFSFFIARIDFGLKLYDPVLSRLNQWRIGPTWNEDLAIHLAIGYPF